MEGERKRVGMHEVQRRDHRGSAGPAESATDGQTSREHFIARRALGVSKGAMALVGPPSWLSRSMRLASAPCVSRQPCVVSALHPGWPASSWAISGKGDTNNDTNNLALNEKAADGGGAPPAAFRIQRRVRLGAAWSYNALPGYAFREITIQRGTHSNGRVGDEMRALGA